MKQLRDATSCSSNCAQCAEYAREVLAEAIAQQRTVLKIVRTTQAA